MTEAVKSGTAKSNQKLCFLIIFLLNKHMFKDPDEHYTNGLSLPVHHNPPLIRVSALAPKNKFAEGRYDRGWELWNCREPPTDVMSYYLSIEKSIMFDDPDEHYTDGLSLPAHHNPSNKSGALAPKLNGLRSRSPDVAMLMAPSSCHYWRCK